MKALYICWLACLWSVLPVFSQGYEIKISIKSGNDTVILGHYFAKQDMLIPDDTLFLDKSGKGTFKGSQKLDKGIYFLINNKRKLCDLIMGDEQKFEISADTSDLINKTKFKNSVENTVFFDFQRMNSQKGLQLHQLRQAYEAADADRKDAIRTQLQALNKDRMDYIRRLAKEDTGLYVSRFLNALIPVDSQIPETIDSAHIYYWYRAHFFDNLDIFHPDMLRTPFYEEKLLEYMTRVIPQHPDSICAEADKILAKAQADDAVFRCILVSLFNHYTKSQVMVHENVWVHLADKWYIPFASWSTADYLEKLKAEVVKKKPNLIGNYAPPLELLMVLPPDHFKAAALDTAIKFDLHAGVNIKDFRLSLKGKFTAILFWDYSCSHCKKTIQDLFAIYEDLKNKGLTVIAVQTVNTKEAKGKWIDFVNEHQLFGWTNAWSPYNVKYKDLYDISSTPQIFLLNEKEEIIGKRLVPDQLKMFIE